jgi:hypothetical protein
MNKKPILQTIMFVSVVIINITSIANGIKHQENWLTIAGSVGLALILFAGVLNYKSSRTLR